MKIYKYIKNYYYQNKIKCDKYFKFLEKDTIEEFKNWDNHHGHHIILKSSYKGSKNQIAKLTLEQHITAHYLLFLDNKKEIEKIYNHKLIVNNKKLNILVNICQGLTTISLYHKIANTIVDSDILRFCKSFSAKFDNKMIEHRKTNLSKIISESNKKRGSKYFSDMVKNKNDRNSLELLKYFHKNFNNYTYSNYLIAKENFISIYGGNSKNYWKYFNIIIGKYFVEFKSVFSKKEILTIYQNLVLDIENQHTNKMWLSTNTLLPIEKLTKVNILNFLKI